LIHTEREAWPWHGAVLAIRAARLASLLFGLATLVGTWGLSYNLLDDRRAALIATALVALTPQFIFMSGVVSNDTAAAALATLTIWQLSVLLRQHLTYPRAILIGALAGLAVLTKVSNLLLLPFVAAVILWVSWRDRVPFRSWVSTAIVCGLTALVIGGWWYIRNILLYGDPLGIQVHTNTLWGRATPASLGTLLSELPTLYRSFWGAFGWGHIRYSVWIYIALGIPLVISGVGWGQSFRRCIKIRDTGYGFLLVALWCSGVFLALLQWMRQVEAPHGRLLFPAIGAWAVLIVQGWRQISFSSMQSLLTMRSKNPTTETSLQTVDTKGKNPFKSVDGLSWLTVSGLLLLNLVTPWAVLRPALAQPRLLSPDKATATVAGSQLTFGDTARLLGHKVTPYSLIPGTWFDVRACWEALAPMERDYTVFVQLVGRDMTRAAERLTYPGLGRFPTSLWPTGQAFCDTYHVYVEDWTPTPELYDLIIGLYDAETEERLPVQNNTGDDVGLPIVAQVRVAPKHPVSIRPMYPLAYNLGPAIQLTGYDLEGDLQSNTSLTVTLYWHAQTSPDMDYQVFVQLFSNVEQTSQSDRLESPSYIMIAQHDGAPRHTRYPTSAWHTGDIIPDPHVLQLPELAPESHFYLMVGMYRADTLERLPVTDPDKPVPDNAIRIEVQP
ncbi:MAG: glycosyltransferase family 39 protein, partial [Anaerolineae bacterium]|nr:glycosyltransferase family 39 protein [Anaerolineae bacterium]